MMKEFRMYFYYILLQVSLPGATGCDLGLNTRAPGSALMWSPLTGCVLPHRSFLSLLLSLLAPLGGATPPHGGHPLGHHGVNHDKHNKETNNETNDVFDARNSVGNLHCEAISDDGCQLRGARSKLSKLDSLASRPMKPQSAAPSPLSKQEREKRTSEQTFTSLIFINFNFNILLHHRKRCDGGAIIRDQFQAIYIAVNPPSPGHLMTG